MKQITSIIITLLAIASNASADNLKVNAVTCTPGTSVEIPVELINTKTNYTQYQLSVVLPDGFELTKVKNAKRFSITPGRANRPDGSYIIMASQSVEYDDEGDPKPLKKISGTSGTLFTLIVNVPASASGTKTIALKAITLSDENAAKTVLDDVNISISVKAQEPVVTLSEGIYYVRNLAKNMYISCGGNWGTHIMVDSRGLDLQLKKAEDNLHWIIETNFMTNISDSGGAIGEEGYVDNYVDTELTIKNLQDNVFSIAAPNGKYLAANSSDNCVYFNASTALGKEAQWEFISEKDILAQRNASLQNASASNPVDATFLIKDANFNRYDLRIMNWYYDEDEDNYSTVNWGCFDEDTEAIYEVFRSDYYDSYGAYALFQIINLIPGIYKLEAQGFYRDGDYFVAEKARSNGKEKKNALLFAGNNNVALKSIFDEASSYKKKGWSTKTTHGYIPDTMSEAGYTFQTGAYNNVLEFTVTKESEIEIGVYILGSYTLNNWTTIDNFRLTYYGNTSTAINDAKSQPNITGNTAVYSLSGQRLAAPQKGVNIIGGKKVVMK